MGQTFLHTKWRYENGGKISYSGRPGGFCRVWETICLETNAKVRMLDENLKEDPIEGMIETVPTYCALIIHYRPEVIRYGKLVKELEKRLGNMHAVDNSNKKKVVKEVPVYYGGETGRTWNIVQSWSIQP